MSGGQLQGMGRGGLSPAIVVDGTQSGRGVRRRGSGCGCGCGWGVPPGSGGIMTGNDGAQDTRDNDGVAKLSR